MFHSLACEHLNGQNPVRLLAYAYKKKGCYKIMTKILAIVGSLRRESYNLQLAQAAQTYLNGKAELEIADIHDIPLFNQDIETPAPAAVAALRQKVKEADGVWFFSPEYNHQITGVLKNTLDWLSRPISSTEPQVLAGKPAALSGTGLGIDGTIPMQDMLASLLSFLNMNIMNSSRLTIPSIWQQAEGSRLKLKDSQKSLEKQADAFLAFLSK